MALYELAVLGFPSTDQLASVAAAFEQAASQFKLRIGDEIRLVVHPATFRPDQRVCAAALFFGGTGGADIDMSRLSMSKASLSFRWPLRLLLCHPKSPRLFGA